MFKSILHDIRLAWHRNVLNKIIGVNIGVFLFINLLKFVFTLTGGVRSVSPIYYTILHGLSISKDVMHDILYPWTWFTYMFLHEGLFHLIWNMLLIYYAGRILGDLSGDRRVLPVYILSGLAGALAYVLFSWALPTWPMGMFMLGASASAMGLLWAAAFLSPDYDIQLILLGRVKLKWIAVVLTVVDLVTINTMANTGGHIAHLGGAFMGGVLLMQLRKGVDWISPIADFFERLSGLWDRDNRPQKKKSQKKSPLTIVHKQKQSGRKGSSIQQNSALSQQDKIDRILDKISKSGVDSISKEEKEFLEKVSKK